jgi:NAD(P)-dependent dehydrogenase (short-subunit alcohol dehydrogenase family)
LFILIQALLKHNAKVYLAARTATKANAAIVDLKNETGKEAIFLQLDLADLTAVRKSAEEFLSFVPFSGVPTEISLTILSERRVSCRFLSITRTWLGSVQHVITRDNEMAAWTTAV